jgi:hypothetical protein
MKRLRINEDDLYQEDDYCPHWNGKKFTGIGYEEVNGVIYTETSYKNGVSDGVYQEFSETGTLLKKSYLKDGKGYGVSKSWDKTEKLREISIYSKTGIIFQQKWDISGRLIYKKYIANLGPMIVNTYWKEQFFFENGNLKEEIIYDYKIIKYSKTWDKKGKLTNSYELTTGCERYEYWVEYNQQTTSTNPFNFSK